MRWKDVRKRLSEMSAHPRFNTRVVDLLELAALGTYAISIADESPEKAAQVIVDKLAKESARVQKLRPAQQRAEIKACEDYYNNISHAALSTPAGSFADVRARLIYDVLDKKKLPDDHLKVEDREFASKEDAIDAIRDLARRVQVRLKKQARKR